MFLSMYRNDSRPRNSQDDHLDFIVYVLIEPVTFLHYQQHHVQAFALAQRDRVSPTLLPRLLLAQAGDLGGQIEALQRSVQGPLGLWVRPRSHTLSFLELGHLVVISQECYYRTSN